MLRLRNLAIVAAMAWAIYALLPGERKVRLGGRIREFGRALVLSLVLYWILMLGRAWFAA